MTDLETTQPDVERSTVVSTQDTTSPSGGGAPDLNPEKPEVAKPAKESVGDSVRNALKEIQSKPDDGDEDVTAEEPKAKDDKPKDATKPEEKAKEATEDDKPVKEAKTEDQPKGEKGAVEGAKGTGQDEDESRQSEGRKFHEPPARFLPKAKEVWSNVPNAVKAEISRIEQEHEQETRQYQEDRKFREELKDYDGMARQAGISVKQALDRYVSIDKALNDPAPLKRAQTMLSLMTQHGVDPVKFSEEVLKNRQHFQNAPRPDPTVQRNLHNTTSEVEKLKQELASLKQGMTVQKYETGLFAEFKRDNPRFDELRSDIAFFLNSGKISSTLSERERLEAAYDMAERVNPVSASRPTVSDQVAPELPDSGTAKTAELSGTKSIKSSPGGEREASDKRRKESARQTVESLVRSARL